jgi:23S rRNA pseudouridine2605 synthase
MDMKEAIVAPRVLCYQAALMTSRPKPYKHARKPHQRPSEPKPDARIAKVIARAGLASRREAEAWIAAGRVAINGTAISTPAVNVGPRDTVTVDGKPLPQRERTRLFLFHKPRGLVTTNADPEGRPTIFGALPRSLPRLITVGRLDLNTEGLLLLTNDGGLARVLELPETGWLRRYRVRAHGTVTQAQLDALRDGVTIDGIHYGAIEASLDRPQGSNVWLTFAIREGKNREVRNVLEHLGLKVNRLIRISFGPFQLGDLADGAIEEVKTRTLQDQLGPRVTAQANADFDAPLREEERLPRPKPTSRHPERRTDSESRHPEERLPRPKPMGRHPEERAQRVSKEGGGHAGRRSPDQGQGRPFEPRPRRAPQDDAESKPRPRPWRGRERERPIEDRATEADTPRKTRAGLLTDRKGRRVLVQRVQSEAKPEERESRPPRFGKPGTRPRRPDRASGPRPNRSDRSNDQRPSRPDRSGGPRPRPSRPRGDKGRR